MTHWPLIGRTVRLIGSDTFPHTVSGRKVQEVVQRMPSPPPIALPIIMLISCLTLITASISLAANVIIQLEEMYLNLTKTYLCCDHQHKGIFDSLIQIKAAGRDAHEIDFKTT